MPGAAQEQQQQRPALVHVVLVRNGQHTDSTYLHITPDLVTVGDALRRVLPEAPPASDVVCETSDDRRQWARADTDIPLQPLIDDYGHRFLRFTVSGGGVFGGQSFTLPSIPFLGRFGKQSSHCRNRSISPKQLQQQNRDVEDGESKPQTPHDRSAKLFGVGRDLILSIMVGTAVYLLADVVLRETYSDPLVNDTLSSEQPAKLSAAGASQHAAAASSRTPQPQSARLQLPAATPVPPQNPHEAQRTPFSYYQGLPRGPSGCPGVHEAAADPNMLRQRGEGEWRRDFGGSGAFYRFCPAAGARRMTPDSLNTCLAGKKVLFAGDSNLRAVYLSLVEWLEGGYQEPEPRALNTSNRVILSNAWQPAHPQHPQALADPPGGISIYPQDWPSWEDFFLSRARRLEGRFCCDCYRHDPGRSPNWEGAGTGASDTSKEWMSRENMHYVSDKTGVQASFHLLHGDRGGRALAMSHTKGCVNASGSSTSPQAYHQQSWPGGWAWEGVVGNLAEVLRSKGYVADVVVLAGGSGRPRWTWAKKAHRLRPVFDAVESLLRPGTGRAVYQTTLLHCSAKDAMLGRAVVERHVQEELRKRQPGVWGYVDATAMSTSLTAQLGGAQGVSPEATCGAWHDRQPAVSDVFVDDKHYQPYVYFEILHQVLLALGC